MPSLYARLDALRRLPGGLRDAALVACLDAAGPGESDALVADAVERLVRGPAPAIARAIVGLWPDLTLEAKRASAAHAGSELAAAANDLLGDPEARGPTALDDTSPTSAADASTAVAAFAADVLSGDAPAAGLDRAALAELLACCAEPDDPSATRAIAGLTRVVRTLDRDDPAATPLDAALASAASRYDRHRCHAVLDAVLARADRPGPALRRWLDDSGEPGHLALRSAARAALTGDAARAVRLLAVPAVAPAAMERLAGLDDAESRLSAVRRAHLLRARGRARWFRSGPSVVPAGEALSGWSAPDRVAAVRWLASSGGAPGSARRGRATQLGGHLTDADPGVRLLAVHALSAEPPNASADELLFEFALDADTRVARSAARVLASARTPHRRAALGDRLRLLSRSPDPAVRRLSQRSLDAWGERRRAGDGRAVWLEASAARRALGRDRAGTLDELRAQLSGAYDRGTVIATLGLARRLRIGRELGLEILACAGSDDAHISAKAVLVLPSVGGDAAIGAARAALHHADGRTRAAAVEALAGLAAGASADPGLDERLLRDETPRVRANTIRAFIARERDARAYNELAEMLADGRPAHRRSALWLAERTSATHLSDRVAELARVEHDGAVRERARRCGRRLLAEMRLRWRRRRPAEAEGPAGALAGGGDGWEAER